MRYQRCTLCRKTKISYSLVPFSSPCNRSSNFIVNHHVSVLFSLLSLSLSLFRSFFPSACVSFFVRVLYTEQLFPLSLPAVSNNNEESKRSIGQRESHPLPECICSGAPRISATVSPLCIENFHPPWAIRCMPGRNVLVLDIAVEYCEQQPLLSLASFLILILLFGFLPVLVPVCLPLLRLLFEKQSEPDFWKDFLLLYNNMIINGRNFGNKAKLYIYISSSALFLALTYNKY